MAFGRLDLFLAEALLAYDTYCQPVLSADLSATNCFRILYVSARKEEQ